MPDIENGRPVVATTEPAQELSPPSDSSIDSVAVPGTLDAYRDRDEDLLWVWCEHEQLWHRHGGMCECPTYLGDHPDPNWDGFCTCVGTGDGHRGAHCRCVGSPHWAVGYVLREVGDLTPAVLARHREATFVRGCREGSCRVDRQRRLERVQQPAMLPAPDDPLSVADQLMKGYAAVDWTDQDPDEDRTWAALWGRDDAPMPGYDPVFDGPPALRRWRGSWMRWRETHWTELEDAELTAELYARLGASVWAKRVKDKWVAQEWKPTRKSVAEVAAAIESLTLLPSTTDAPSWLSSYSAGRPRSLVSCANGLLDTETRDLLEHDPDWFNLVAVPFRYDPMTPAPERWLGFLEQLWPEDQVSIDALQEWFGYVLSGRTDLQKLFLVVGPPRSGKGTIVRILQELVGRGNYAGPTLASLGTNFGLQALIGKPLAVVADARLGGKDTHVIVERLLSISGEDTLTVDRKYRDAWNGRLPTRVMVLSNELPHFGDASGAIATRFVTLVLTESWLGREDIDLERTLQRELPGILLWALDGLARLNERRRFSEPASSAESVVAMADSASPTSAFVRERCEVGVGKQATTRQLYDAWRGWCFENGREHPGNEQTFGRTLRSVIPAVKQTRPRDPVSGRPVRTWNGVGLIRSDPRISPLSSQQSALIDRAGGGEGE